MDHRVVGSRRVRWGGIRRRLRSLPVHAFLLLIAASPAAAQSDGENALGRVVFVEGSSRWTRELLDSADFGMPLENYDLLSTAPEALLEMTVSAGDSPQARIILQGDSAGVILRRPEATVFRLFYGSVRVEGSAAGAAEGGPGRPLHIQVAGDTAEIRGGRFTVDRSFTGSVLVTSAQGPAELRLPDGEQQFADRSRAILLNAEGELRSVPVPPEGIDAARRRRRFDGIRDFQSAPDRYLEEAFGRYFTRREAFTAAYEELMGLRDIFDLWIENDRTERRASRAVLEAQLQRVEPLLGDTMSAMQDFATAYYALRKSEGYLPVRGFDPEQVYPLEGRSLRSLYDELAGDAEVYERHMHVLRYLAKLHAERRERL